LQKVIQSPYSRLPVYRGSLDQILGAISAKAVVAHFAASGSLPPIEQLLRPLPFVPGTLRSHRFIRFLQQEHSSKAMVVDEHGGVQGIISVKDVLWELFGEIGDELAEPEVTAEVLPDGSIRLPGSLRRGEVEQWLGTRWEGSATTVGGHIVAALGRLPVEGEQIEVDGVQLTVTDMSPTTVRWLVASPCPAQEPSAETPSPSIASS
jgi:putative hemolysin